MEGCLLAKLHHVSLHWYVDGFIWSYHESNVPSRIFIYGKGSSASPAPSDQAIHITGYYTCEISGFVQYTFYSSLPLSSNIVLCCIFRIVTLCKFPEGRFSVPMLAHSSRWKEEGFVCVYRAVGI